MAVKVSQTAGSDDLALRRAIDRLRQSASAKDRSHVMEILEAALRRDGGKVANSMAQQVVAALGFRTSRRDDRSTDR